MSQPIALDAERQDLVARFVHLARKEARRFAPRWSTDFDDVLSTAFAALVQAGATFDPSMGAFPSYARRKIRGWLLNARNAHDRADRAGRAPNAPHIGPLIGDQVDRRADRPDARLEALEAWEGMAGKIPRPDRP